MGATVTVAVADAAWGQFLASLEWAADVHIVDVFLNPARKLRIATLRSDRFPTHWERRRIEFKIGRAGQPPRFLCGSAAA